MAQAINVHKETGRTPRELAEDVRELRRIFQWIADNPGCHPNTIRHEAIFILAKTEPKQP